MRMNTGRSGLNLINGTNQSSVPGRAWACLGARMGRRIIDHVIVQTPLQKLVVIFDATFTKRGHTVHTVQDHTVHTVLCERTPETWDKRERRSVKLDASANLVQVLISLPRLSFVIP